jgi:flagellar biosynthesis/type III secretory pathway M-ring protein FliF/YscJ
VQTLLDSALGAGQAITRVSAQVNFDQMERTEEKFDPNAVMRQKTRSSESTKGRSTTPGSTPAATTAATAGDPAATAQAAAAAGANGAVSQNDGSRESESITYEVSRTVAKTLTSPGEIRRLSVAVVVNAPRPAAGADPKTAPAPAPAPRSAEELEKIRQVVMTAVGFSEPRGDSVTVAEMPFDTSVLDRERALLEQPAPPAPPGARGLTIGTPIIAVAGGVVVVVIALFAWLILRGRARTRERAEVAVALERVPEATAAALVREAGGGMPTAAAVAAAAAAMPRAPRAPQPIVPEDMLQLTREREDIREKALAMASSEPDATAQLLRAWLVKKKNLTMTAGSSHAS